jgi:inorganic pyrophosphatase
MQPNQFWQRMDALVREGKVVIDRPRGSAHPRYPEFIYPYDYGYIEGTQAADMGGIDVWVGSQKERGVTGIICTVDITRRDAELKILWGCSVGEAQEILRTHNDGSQSAVLLERPDEEGAQASVWTS